MLDYYDWKELRKITKLLRRALKLPGDIGFEWPRPLREPPLPRPRPMEITKIIEPVPVQRKNVLLTYDELHMLVDAMNEYYSKYMRKISKTDQPRTKKESIELGLRQELFQRIARARNEWETVQ